MCARPRGVATRSPEERRGGAAAVCTVLALLCLGALPLLCEPENARPWRWWAVLAWRGLLCWLAIPLTYLAYNVAATPPLESMSNIVDEYSLRPDERDVAAFERGEVETPLIADIPVPLVSRIIHGGGAGAGGSGVRDGAFRRPAAVPRTRRKRDGSKPPRDKSVPLKLYELLNASSDEDDL